LFWPPLPEGGFGRDRDRYRAMSDHIKRLANRYALPLWVADGPWPDELFMDKFGHLNLQGRQRFAGEIAAWARSL
jgi:lysophospholipase L1-like esterase